MARTTAGLGHDPGDRQVAQAHRLAGQDLMGYEDHRFVPVPVDLGAGRDQRRLQGQVGPDPRDHVANVGHPLAGSSRAQSGRTWRRNSGAPVGARRALVSC